MCNKSLHEIKKWRPRREKHFWNYKFSRNKRRGCTGTFKHRRSSASVRRFYRYVLTYLHICRLTETFAYHNCRVCSKGVYNGWVIRFGFLEEIVTNQGNQFESALFTELNKSFICVINHCNFIVRTTKDANLYLLS